MLVYVYVKANIAYIHPIYGAGVRTHDLFIMSLLTLPLDQRCPTFLLIGQKFEAKSLGGQVLDLKLKIFVELPLIMT
jgi:hypothetical protein